MTKWPKALATAFIFLTRLPMPQLKSIEPEDEGRCLSCFPIVGLAIGLLLWLIAFSLSSFLLPIVLAAVLTAFWAAVTGSLHLDGLADSADGWLGGINDVDRTLEIMHDSRCGSGALVAVVCVLLMKFAALTVIVQQQLWIALIVAPIIGRCISPLLFIPGSFPYTPYVQAKGIAKHFIDHSSSSARHIALLTTVICVFLLGNLSTAIIVFGAILLTVFLMRKLMLKRLGGATGDTAGATTEMIEVVVLITAGALSPMGL